MTWNAQAWLDEGEDRKGKGQMTLRQQAAVRRLQVQQCLNCKNRVPCRENHWVRTYGDGVNCDNFEGRIGNGNKNGMR